MGGVRSNRCHSIIALALIPAWLGAGRSARALDPPLNAVEVGHWDGYPGAYADIWADGDYVYLPNWGSADDQPARVHVLDISDPGNPVLDDTLFVPPPNEFSSPQDVKSGAGLLFVGLEADPNDGVAIFDVRDPADRRFLTYVTVAGFQTVHNLFYADGFLYIPEGTSIAVVDLTEFDPDDPDPATITEAAWILTGVGSSSVHDITVAGGRLYVAAWDSGLWVYDVSDVAGSPPVFLGSVDGDNTHSMWPTADARFVVTGEERPGGGIRVFEMEAHGDLIELTLRDAFAFPPAEVSSVHNQVVVGYRVYNSWYGKGLQVFDIDPASGALTLVASFDTTDSGLGNWGVYPLLGDDRILLSDTTEGCFVVALDLPAVPAASAWLLTLLGVVVLAVGSAVLRRRHARHA